MIYNKYIQNIIRISIFIIILFILFFKLRNEDFNNYLFLFSNFKFIFYSFLLLTFLSIVSILRWKIILEILSQKKIKIKSLIKPGYYSYLSDQINILGFFASRSVYTPDKISIKTSLLSAVIEKVLSFFTKGLFCIPGLLFIYLNIESFYLKNYLSQILIVSFFLFILFILIFTNKIKGYIKKFLNKYKIHSNLNKKQVFLLIIFSFLIQITILNLTFYIHMQLNSNLSYIVFYLLASVSFFASSMPISISQWGLREVSFFIVFSSFVEGNILIITSLIYGVTILIYFVICNCAIFSTDIIQNIFKKIKNN